MKYKYHILDYIKNLEISYAEFIDNVNQHTWASVQDVGNSLRWYIQLAIEKNLGIETVHYETTFYEKDKDLNNSQLYIILVFKDESDLGIRLDITNGRVILNECVSHHTKIVKYIRKILRDYK